MCGKLWPGVKRTVYIIPWEARGRVSQVSHFESTGNNKIGYLEVLIRSRRFSIRRFPKFHTNSRVTGRYAVMAAWRAPCASTPLKRHGAICPRDANGRKPLAERRKPRWLLTLSVDVGLFLAGKADDHQKSLRFAPPRSMEGLAPMFS